MQNNRFEKGTDFGINIGSSSLIMIFVILCLVCFATLSIVSAVADRKLSKKVTDRSDVYYEACNLANEKLAQIDQSLSEIYKETSSQIAYFEKAGNTIDFSIPVGEIHTLCVSLRITYPDSPDKTYYEITSWNLEATGVLDELDTSLPVMQ